MSQPTPPNARPTIRRGTEADVPALVRLERAVYTSDLETEDDFRRFLADTPRSEVWIIEAARPVRQGRGNNEPSSIMGSCVLVHGRTNTRIYGIQVFGRYRGRGVGAALLAHARRRARRSGKRRVTLEVRRDNDSAIGFYEEHGFRRIGTRPAFYEDGETAIRMALELDG